MNRIRLLITLFIAAIALMIAAATFASSIPTASADPVFPPRPNPAPVAPMPQAVVVPGARAVTVGNGKDWGLSLATPVIVKYRDSRTDTRTELEAWIR